MTAIGGRGAPTAADAGKPDWVENEAPSGRWPPLRLSDLWRHHELIYFFALRDLKVRYKQAFLGASWAVLQPLAGAIAFTILFNGLAGVEVAERSYFGFALAGFVAWTYFSTGISEGSMSLLANSELVTKVPFPKVVAPVAALVPGLLDLLLGILISLGYSIAFSQGVTPLAFLLGLTGGTALLVATTAGPAVALSAMIVKYRDVRVVVGFGLQLLLFISPVAYPPELVAERWRTVQYANPLAGCLGLYRSALIGTPPPTNSQLLLSTTVALLLLVGGLIHFRINERQFADII